jgi:phosphoglycolate phosphatase-like HAD superfamily hydrolase
MHRGAVIFDRDGTVLDFSEMFYRFVIDLYRVEGMTPPDREAIVDLDFWNGIVARSFRIGRVLVKQRLDDIPRRFMPFGALYPGVREALLCLRSEGYRLAMCSGWIGTRETEVWLGSCGLSGVFDVLVTADDGDPLADPDQLGTGYAAAKARVLGSAIARLGRLAGPLTVVGDMPEDIAAGKQCGARTVAVLTGNGTRMLPSIQEQAPDWIVASAANLPDLLRGAGRPPSSAERANTGNVGEP